MNRIELITAVDALATRDPAGAGYGYSDGQFAWRHDPAIEQSRTTFHDLLEAIDKAGLRGTFVQIGLGRHGGGHRALRLLAQRVVTVEIDGARLAAFAGAADFDPARDVLVEGDAGEATVIERVRQVANGCDVLLLDGDDCYEAARRDWEHYAPMVRPGGLVAIVDVSQAYPVDGRLFDVDRFVVDLERDWLRPRGSRSVRLGGAHAIHIYQQTAATAAPGSLPWPAGFLPTPQPVRDGEVAGWSIHAWNGGYRAVPGDVPALACRALWRNEPSVVLAAKSRAAVTTLVETFAAVSPLLADARAALAAGHVDVAAAMVQRVDHDFPGLRAALRPSLEASPMCKSLLLAQGTLALFTGAPEQGVALLRRALSQDMFDRELLQTTATACMRVLQDPVAARELLVECKQAVRRKKTATVCHQRLTGHVLWHYPQLLTRVRGVLQVGAHTGEEVEAFQLLELEHQAYIEPQPAAFARLQQRCRELECHGEVLLDCAVGEQAGTRELRLGQDTAHASFLPTHALARVPAAAVQTQRLPVLVQTLDQLVAAGRLDPRRYNMLFVDTEGSELDVLRGATGLLAHVDLVSVAVFNEPVYDGAPMPQQIQFFLREVNDGDGFYLRAFEPGPDPARGDAVFQRIRVRR